MSISKSYNKNTGITYVYEVLENKWDPVKKRAVNKRKLIGKIDPVTGEMVPTRKKGQTSSSVQLQSSQSSPSSIPAVPADIETKESLKQFLVSQANYLEHLIDSSQKQLTQIRALLDSIESK